MNYADQVRGTSMNYAQGISYKRLSENAKELKLPWDFIKFDILSILAFNRFETEGKE